MSKQYSRPPLIEAAIEIRLGADLGEDELQRYAARFERLSWRSETMLEIQFEIGKSDPPKQTPVGKKFTNAEATTIVQAQKRALSLSRLPPYDSWEGFVDDFMTQWRPFRKLARKVPLDRIGVRYINRFDLPGADTGVLIGDYLNFHVVQPTFISQETSGYSAYVGTAVEGHNLRVNLQSQLAPSPIIGHVSIFLDIDLYRESVDVPQDDADILTLFAEMRAVRTRIFEACITDKARALIS